MAARLLRRRNIPKSKTLSFPSLIQSRSYWKHPTRGHHEPFFAIAGKQPVECSSALETMQKANIKSNQRIFVHGAAMTPGPLLQALCEYASEKDLSNINLVHIHLMGDAPFVNQEKYRKHFRDNSLFIGANVRKHVNTGDADFTPMFLSEIPRLFEDPDYRIDHAFVSVSPPDKHGYVSFMRFPYWECRV